MKIGHAGHRQTTVWCWTVALLAAAAILPGGATRTSAGEGPNDAGSPPAASPYSPYHETPVSSSLLTTSGARIADSSQKPSAYVVLYPGKEVLAKICKEQTASETAVQELLKALLTCPEVRPDNITWTVDGRLVVEASAAGHKQVEAMLDSIRKFGLPQIVIETRFVAINREELKKVLPDSTMSPLDMPETGVANGADVRPAGFDRLLRSHEGNGVARLEFIVEKAPPLRFRILEKEQGDKWLNSCQNDRHTNVLQAPKVTVFSGQTACVSDTSQTPFVVGLKKLNEDTQQPRIRVVSEGTTLQLRPTAGSSGVIHLDFSARFSKIQKVDTVTFPLTSAGGGTIQIPEVATVRMEGGVALRPGQCLLLCGWEALDQQFVETAPEPNSWKDWLLSGGKRFKAQDTPELVLMLKTEMIQPPHAATNPVLLPSK